MQKILCWLNASLYRIQFQLLKRLWIAEKAGDRVDVRLWRELGILNLVVFEGGFSLSKGFLNDNFLGLVTLEGLWKDYTYMKLL